MFPIDPNQHVDRYADDYVHDLLESRNRAAFEQHCRSCERCRAALKAARQRLAMLQQLPVREAPRTLVEAALDGAAEFPASPILHPPKRRSAPWRQAAAVFWGVAAVAAMILAVCHAYFAEMRPSPYDLLVLGQSTLVPGTDGSLRVRLVNSATGGSVADTLVQVRLSNKQADRSIQLASFTTDAHGTGNPRIRLPDWPDGEYQLQIRASVPGRDEQLTRPLQLRRNWRLMLTSDKPVYQPGQTIHLRGLALQQSDRRPAAGHDVEYSINDPKGNVIFRHRGVTSRFGISFADCALATEINEGPYTVECRMGETTSNLTVDVKRYVLPKFKIDLQLDRSFYQPGDLVRGQLAARYFFGQPVAEGTATVEVTALEIGEQSLGTQTLTLDEDGRIEFEFRLPETLIGREQQQGDALVRLDVRIADTAGQQEQRSSSVPVTVNPLRITVIPESGSLVVGIVNRVYFFATYADGQPASARIAIRGFDSELTTNDLGVAMLEIAPKDEGIDWTVSARDREGQATTMQVQIPCGQASDDFLLRPDRAVYEGGQTAQLNVWAGGLQPVFLDVVRAGQTLLTETVEIRGGRGQLTLDLAPELSGTIELCAYRFSQAGLPVRKSRVIFVRPAEELRLRATWDRDEYRPGERAKLQLTVTEAGGRAAPGAVSLAVVDEAVYSVLDRRPGLERSFFLLEQDLLQPVYALYDWTPWPLGNEAKNQRELLDQALFARAGRDSQRRDALVRELVDQHLDGDASILDVLQRPDVEQLAEWVELPPEMLKMLRGGDSPHTLQATSFPAKKEATERFRRAALERMRQAWIALGVLAAVAALATLFRGSVVEWLVVVLILLILAALMLPAIQAAREAARRTQAVDNMKNIGLALQNMQDARGRPLLQPGETPAPQPRVRQWFPETLLWRPELITDDQGRVDVEVDLADSITSWRVLANAVTAAGQLGADQSQLRVFQPFFVDLDLPVALTRGDELSVPVIVYNYLDRPQTVELSLQQAGWFEPQGPLQQSLTLEAGQVRSLHFPLRALRVGQHQLQVTARGEDLSDAIRREVEVAPDGRLVEQTTSGTLNAPVQVALPVPPDAIPGSVKAIVKIYPSSFSQVIENLDGIFCRPYGCFEQTSSTTYPNVLALDYLRRTSRSVPEVEAKAQQYIHLGYQRLLGFEVDGGGFDWFGNPPANRTLTAYGLMEFEDMARVHDVDRQVIERTRKWLLAQQNKDGSWDPDGDRMHDDPTGRGGEAGRLATTAYVAWAAFRQSGGGAQGQAASAFLQSHSPESIASPYVLALVCNALLAIDAEGQAARPYLNRLLACRQSDAGEKLCWWTQSAAGSTLFYGAGRSGDIETTATAALALLADGREVAAVRGALAWLVQQKDGVGTWGSTQATVLALRALVAGSGQPLAEGRSRQISLALDDQDLHTFEISPIESDVVKQYALDDLAAGSSYWLRLADRSGTAAGYQVVFRYSVPEREITASNPALQINLEYDRSQLNVDQIVQATSRIANRREMSAPMVIVDLPIPAGFAVEPDDFQRRVADGTIAKYQLTARNVILYLRALPPRGELVLTYRLRATMPVKIQTPPAAAYLYYEPETRIESKTSKMRVQPRSGDP